MGILSETWAIPILMLYGGFASLLVSASPGKSTNLPHVLVSPFLIKTERIRFTKSVTKGEGVALHKALVFTSFCHALNSA